VLVKKVYIKYAVCMNLDFWSFDLLHVQIFMQQNILRAMKLFVEMIKNAATVWQFFLKNGERVKSI